MTKNVQKTIKQRENQKKTNKNNTNPQKSKKA